jgi:hypothetical protein
VVTTVAAPVAVDAPVAEVVEYGAEDGEDPADSIGNDGRL